MTDAENPEVESAEAEPAKPKGKMLTAGLILAGLMGGGAAGAFAVGPTIAHKLVPSHTADSAAADSTAHSDSAGGSSEATLHVIENLVLNPAASGGTRFLLFTVGLQLKDAATKELARAREIEVRDTILRVLGAKRVEELTDITNRDHIRSEVQAAVDSLFTRPSVKAVYFPQFVIQ